jgi:hypothetical protein
MALVLSLRSGHDFYVGDDHVVVTWIDSPFRFGLKLNSERNVTLTDKEWTPIFDGVRMQAGIPRNQESMSLVRVVIDAPELTVLRGSLYRQGNDADSTEKFCQTCNGTKTLSRPLRCPDCLGHGCDKCNKGEIVETFKCPEC